MERDLGLGHLEHSEIGAVIVVFFCWWWWSWCCCWVLGELLEDDVEERFGKTTVINAILLLEMNVKRPAVERMSFCFWIEILSGCFQAGHDVLHDVRSADVVMLCVKGVGREWPCLRLVHEAVDFERSDAIREGEVGGCGGVCLEMLFLNH